MRDLGLSDLDIMRRLKIQPQSFTTQLRRYNIPFSPELKRFMADRAHGVRDAI